MSLDDPQITIAGVRFDRVRYDAEADVLYLHVGTAKRPSTRALAPPRETGPE